MPVTWPPYMDRTQQICTNVVPATHDIALWQSYCFFHIYPRLPGEGLILSELRSPPPPPSYSPSSPPRPQPRALEISGHCRTSTASSRSQQALPDLSQTPVRISDRMLDRMSDWMPARMPERMSEHMPKSMSVRIKCHSIYARNNVK